MCVGEPFQCRVCLCIGDDDVDGGLGLVDEGPGEQEDLWWDDGGLEVGQELPEGQQLVPPLPPLGQEVEVDLDRLFCIALGVILGIGLAAIIALIYLPQLFH
jgi:hypothetical protein